MELEAVVAALVGAGSPGLMPREMVIPRTETTTVGAGPGRGVETIELQPGWLVGHYICVSTTYMEQIGPVSWSAEQTVFALPPRGTLVTASSDDPLSAGFDYTEVITGAIAELRAIAAEHEIDMPA